MDRHFPEPPSIVSGKLESFSPSPELYTLLKEQIQRYTMGDSTSVPVDTAADILRSIQFTIAFLKDEDTAGVPLKKQLETGRTKIKARMEDCRRLYEQVKVSAPDGMNIAYQDTIVEIGGFFSRYDLYFAAHDIPCMIDYPLLHPVERRLGLEFIEAYLGCLLFENAFLSRFEPAKRISLYEAYVPDYAAQIVNLCEPVLTNAIGKLLLKENPYDLDIPDPGPLAAMLTPLSEAELTGVLNAAAGQLCDMLSFRDEFSLGYLSSAANNLLPRILLGKGFENIFLSLKRQAIFHQKRLYRDQAPMADEALRELIEKIRGCPQFTEKTSIALARVKSVRDLKEVLNSCFYGDEQKAALSRFPKRLQLAYKAYIRDTQRETH
ncbi:DUF6179 domain-containing protein [Christensenellaceae bacterium OttesenSCG-928-M15]|nr:DUF6179 domain-containing protein [Christensenellaceae bacterium OttesenSCG-928-M15]